MLAVFNKLIYPGLAKIGVSIIIVNDVVISLMLITNKQNIFTKIVMKPLVKMSIGMTFAALAFVFSGLIEIWLDYDYLHVAWQVNNNIFYYFFYFFFFYCFIYFFNYYFY